MKKDIREIKEKLYYDSIELKNLSNKYSGDIAFKLRDEQDKKYKKWLFYTNILKANDKINKIQ